MMHCRDVAEQSVQRQSVVMHAKGGGGGGGGKGGKGDAKGGAPAMDVSQIEKATLKDTEDRMKKCVLVVGENFNSIRTGRANPAILDRIMVLSFGAEVLLKSLAAVTVPESTVLLISPFDSSPASIKAIEKAINESDIGINPSNDGERIRLSLPQLTQDRRKELVKQAGKLAEEGKVAVRNVRGDALKKVGKLDLPKDNKKNVEDGIQKLTDTLIKSVEDSLKKKSEELMKL
ncbi:MAG: hypothetical protein WDW38_000947 [Sanguina aurantia]